MRLEPVPQHGSWNRKRRSGYYKLIFVPFADGGRRLAEVVLPGPVLPSVSRA